MTETTKIEIIANGQQPNATINQLAASIRVMTKDLKNMSTASKEFTEGKAKLVEMKDSYGKVTKEIVGLGKASSNTWQTIKGGMLGVMGGNMLSSAFMAVKSFVSSVVQKNYDLSDSYANIKKVTSLTDDQIKELDKTLGNFNTRTAKKDLRELAVEAGKLGKDGVADIANFVKEADMIKVALGEDLGPEAITMIGRLSGIFKVSMLEIGSAINEIGAQSAATEGYQVDFLNRMAGTGPTAKLAAGELLGYSATLENMGQTAEVSGSALSKFFVNFIKDTEKFGKIAGMGKGNLTEIFNSKGTNAAFIAFLENLKKTKGGMVDLARSLDEMGIDGARSTGVFLALANNTAEVSKQQAIANKAIKDGTSLTNEFNIKNDTFAAKMDKVGKAIQGGIANSGIAKLINNIVTSFVEMNTEADAANIEFNKLIDSELRMQSAMNVDLDILKDKNLNETVRKDLLKEVNTAYGQYLPYLLTEKSSIEDITKAQNLANIAFDRSIFLKTYHKEIEEANLKVLTAQKGLATGDIALRRLRGTIGTGADADEKQRNENSKKLIEQGLLINQKAIDDAKKQVKDIEDIYEELSQSKYKKSVNELIGEKTGGTPSAGNGDSTTSKTEAEIKADKKARTEADKAEAKRQRDWQKKQWTITDAEMNEHIRLTYEKGTIEKIGFITTQEDLLGKASLDARRRRIEKELQFAIAGTKEEHNAKLSLIKLQEDTEVAMAKGNEELIADIHRFYAKQKHNEDMVNIRKQLENAQIAIQTGMQLDDAYVTYKQRKDDAELNTFTKNEDKKRAALKTRLDKGVINQEQYQAALDKIDMQQAAKTKAMKEKAWKRQHNADILQMNANISMAVIKCLAEEGYVGAIVAGAIGAVNLALLASQPMPEFAYGGTTVQGQSGKRYNATNIGSFAGGGLYSSPSYGIIGEKGSELVVPHDIYTAPSMAGTMRMLEGLITGREMASGGRTSGNTNSTGNAELMAMISANTSVMQTLLVRLGEPLKAVAYLDPVQSNIYNKQIDAMKIASRIGATG